MNKELFLQKELELFEIFNKFGMSKEILKCGTYKTVCEMFYKNSKEEIMKIYESLNNIVDRCDLVEVELLFKQILFGCDDKSSKPIEEQLYKALWEYIKIKIEYFENKTSLFVDVVFFKICNFIELYYEREFSVKKLFNDFNKKIDEYFEKKKKEDEAIDDLFDRSGWSEDDSGNKVRSIAEVPNDKIVITSTPYGENHFYDIWLNPLKSKVSVKERNEKICEDDLLNLEIAFNTAKSFEDFLNLI